MAWPGERHHGNQCNVAEDGGLTQYISAVAAGFNNGLALRAHILPLASISLTDQSSPSQIGLSFPPPAVENYSY